MAEGSEHLRIKRLAPELRHVARLDRQKQNAYIRTCSNDIIKCICDCCTNIIAKNTNPSKSQLTKLRRRKRVIRQLARKKTSLTEKRKILQRGGFLSALLPTFLNLAAPIISGLVNRSNNNSNEQR